ncbi:MAG TPA: hypothetical protein VF676_06885 [Flavobacterium sp.]|jgi:hypothetical protein
MKNVLCLFILLLLTSCSDDEGTAKSVINYKIDGQLTEISDIYIQPYENQANEVGKLVTGDDNSNITLSFKIFNDDASTGNPVQDFILIAHGPLVGDSESFQDNGIVWNITANNNNRFKATFSGPVKSMSTNQILNLTDGKVEITY